jgi:hypothetical protein
MSGEREFFERLMEGAASRAEPVVGSAHDWQAAHDAAEARRAEEAAARERERIEKLVAEFAEGRFSGTWSCPRCAALVEDRDKHVHFHDEIDKAARDAASALFHHTPLG